MNTISIGDRLTLHALVERLTADGDTFSAVDAEELIAKLPLSPRSSAFQMKALWTGSSSQTGYAAGRGTTTIKEDEEKSFTVGRDGRWRIGGYDIEHAPGVIEISLMWADTLEDATGKVCRLTYDPASKHPLAMSLARQLSFSIGPLHVTYGRAFDPWKRPV